LGVSLVAASSLVASPALATIKQWALGAIGWLVMLIIQFLGWLIISVIPVLVGFASYNTFVTHTAVGVGWSVTRDVVNMFFVLVLLFMAFGTMLGFSKWTARGGNLVNLLLMAVLVNFSRTICGILIDMGQVVMLTFVSGFKEAAGGNFLEAMKLTEVLKMSEQNQASPENVVVSLIMAMVMTAIALFVIVMMTIALAVRIVQLWLLIVISPIAFFLRAVEPGKKYYADWWDQFSNTVIVGPLLAFFLWLALVSVQQGDIVQGVSYSATGETGFNADAMAGTFANASIGQFIIACGLLLMGYKLANSMARQTMGVASSIRQGGAQMGRWAARQSMRAGAAAGGAAAKGVGRIPLFKDATTGKRYGMTEVVGTRVQKIRDWRARRKEGKEISAQERMVAATRRAGLKDKTGRLTAKAQAMEDQVVMSGAAFFAKNKNVSQLDAIMRDTNAKSIDRRKALAALAQQGQLKETGVALRGLITQVGGGETFSRMIRDEKHKRGDAYAYVGAGSATETAGQYFRGAIDREGIKAIKPQLASIARDVEIGTDNQWQNPDAVEVLRTLNAADYREMSEREQKGVESALMKAIETATRNMNNPTLASEFRRKYLELLDVGDITSTTAADYGRLKANQRRDFDDRIIKAAAVAGEDGDLTTMSRVQGHYAVVSPGRAYGRAEIAREGDLYTDPKAELYEAAQRRHEVARLREAATGRLRQSEADRSVAQIFSRDRDAAADAVRSVNELVNRQAGGGVISDSEIAAIITGVRGAVSSTSYQARDAAGNTLNPAALMALFESGGVNSDLQAARQYAAAGEMTEAANRLKSAASQISDGARFSRREDRPQVAKGVEAVRGGLNMVVTGFDQVAGISDPRRARQVLGATLVNADTAIERAQQLAPDLKPQELQRLMQIQQEVANLRTFIGTAREVNPAIVAQMQTLRNHMVELRGLMQQGND
jgi:hypothetical protein